MTCPLKIVADSDIPFLEGVFEPYAKVTYIQGSDISASDVADADALIIRTRTRCNSGLLTGSKVKVIATATIGTDHIDLDYCRSMGIEVYNASGCNAGGVMQYVFSALYGVCAHNGINLSGKVFGIIGVGNVGSRVEHMARYLGFDVLLCDPPRAEKEGPDGFVELDELLAGSDIVTLHTPLNDSTRKMANDDFFCKMKTGAIFINTARGEIVNDEALLQAVPKLGAAVLDTWNNEPNVNRKLLEAVDIATPHVAGYSYQGKMNGTAMAVQAVAHFFGMDALYDFYPRELPDDVPQKLDLSGKSQGEIAAVFQYNYPVFTDDFIFRMNPDDFELQRNNYRYRREIYV